MSICQWLKTRALHERSLPRGAIAALAQRLEISNVYLYQLIAIARQGGPQASAALAVAIERETGVSHRLLWPDDWQRIWPELAEHSSVCGGFRLHQVISGWSAH